MKSKFDDSVKDLFENVEIQPSSNSWEMVNLKLDNQKKTKKIIILKYVASVLVLLSVSTGFFILNPLNSGEIANNKILEKKLIHSTDSTKVLEPKGVAIIDTTPKPSKLAKIKVFKPKKVESKSDSAIYSKPLENESLVNVNNEKTDEDNSLVSVNEASNITNKDSLTITSSRIRINAEDLLYSVMHSKKENHRYFVANISTKSILDTINVPLKNHNKLYNSESILAQVETEMMIKKYKPTDFFTKLKEKVNKVIVALK